MIDKPIKQVEIYDEGTISGVDETVIDNDPGYYQIFFNAYAANTGNVPFKFSNDGGTTWHDWKIIAPGASGLVEFFWTDNLRIYAAFGTKSLYYQIVKKK